jgi:hypothetical protein
MVRQLGNNRRADGTETSTAFQLEGVPALDYGGDACTIAIASALPPDEEARADSDVEALAAALMDGTLTVDPTALTEADPIDQVAVAQQGDRSAARLLVLDGTVARWLDAGVLGGAVARGGDVGQGGGADDLARRLDRIGARVSSTYALFADGLTRCP